VVICLERGADRLAYGPADATATHSARPGSPGKRAVKRACVCVCVCVSISAAIFARQSSEFTLPDTWPSIVGPIAYIMFPKIRHLVLRLKITSLVIN